MSRGRVYDWERLPAWEAAGEAQEAQERAWHDSDSEAHPEPDETENGELLVDFLLSMHYDGKMSAKQLVHAFAKGCVARSLAT